MPESSIDPMLIDMLPAGTREITKGDLATPDKWFGAKGKFPAIHMQSSEIGI
jgi:hypothetical protein